MAEYEEFDLEQGTDFTVELHLVTQDGAAKNLENHSIAAKMKRSYSDSDGDATTFQGLLISPQTEGKATISLTNTQTAALRKGRYVYDVELSFVDSDGETVIERILEGRINVTPSVT